MDKGDVPSDRPTGTRGGWLASPHQKSSQSNRGIGEAVAAAIVVVTPAEDVDGTDDSRSNVSQLGVGGAAAAAAGAGCCWKFRRCDTGGGRGGRCGARALACPFAFAAPLPLALGAPAAFLARMASSVSTYFCTRFSCTHRSSICQCRQRIELPAAAALANSGQKRR